jgi:hypothetical protein
LAQPGCGHRLCHYTNYYSGNDTFFLTLLLFSIFPENCSESKNVHWKKSTNESEDKPEQKFERARLSEQFLVLVTVFKEASKNSILIFLLN